MEDDGGDSMSETKPDTSGFLQVSENWKRSGNLSGQGKYKSDWKVREMLGKLLTFFHEDVSGG